MKIRLTKQAGISLTDRIEQIAVALRNKFKKPGGEEPLYWYPREVYDDAVIVSDDTTTKMYRIPYTIDGDEVSFGEPAEVEELYIEVEGETITESEQVELPVATVSQSLDPEGWSWRVDVCEFGVSQTGDWWTPEPFRQSLPLWEQLQAYADHPTETEAKELPERSVNRVVGWYSNFKVAAQSFEADFHIKRSADWLRQDLKDAFDKGNKNLYGFSLLLLGSVKQTQGPNGVPVRLWTKIVKPISVDLVTKAAAGGKVKYALASSRGRIQHEGATDDMKKKMLARLFLANRQQFELVRQSLVSAGIEGVTIEQTEDQLAGAIAENETAVEQAMTLLEEPPANAGQPARQPQPGEIAFAQLPSSLRSVMIRQSVADSGLPEAVRQALVTRLGTTATLEEVEREVESTREVLALLSQSGQVNNGRSVEVGSASRDKITIGLAKAFRLTRDQFSGNESYIEQEVRQSGNAPFRPTESDWNDIPEIRSIRRLYVDMTGDEAFRGIWSRSNRLTRQAQNPWAVSDFPDLLSNLMHKRLLASYRENTYGIERVISRKPLEDFKQRIIIVLGYFGDLPTVAENGEYTTFAALTDDKEVYSPTKRGKTLDLNIETIANDDLKGIALATDRMGRSARRTLAKFVWNTNLFDNPTLNQDSKALFHADHNNLITDELGTNGLKAGLTKLLLQTEQGSSEKFMISLRNLTLAVRSDLLLDATTLTDFNYEPGGNTDPLARLLRSTTERMSITPVYLPFLSDANDWMLLADPTEVEIVEIGFWMGSAEPEFFDMMGETHEKAFNNDIITRHKVRFIFGGAPVEFRGVVKSTPVG